MINDVNPYMVEIETHLCLSLAFFYDLSPPPHHDGMPEECDTKPEECATQDAPFREKYIEVGQVHGTN
jgi:hypothetical protein